ncbi:MAG TPA: ATP-binding cassette domain-containing protein [Moraxellaceae bacterium]|nr:ATP-binding cassette domain-containing protein [Moraxellaceae bacterium]
MIQLSGVSLHLAGRTLLRTVDLSLQSGCVALIGANGAGKSTLLQLLADGGRYLEGGHLDGVLQLDDQSLRSCPPQALAQRRAFLPQRHSESLPLTVMATLGLATWPWGGGPLPTPLLEEAVERWELAPLTGRRYTALSGGERQRVHLARTWLQLRMQPAPRQRIWLLDEPQTALDHPHQQTLLSSLNEEAEAGALVVFSTHDVNFALRAANHVVALKHGLVAAAGTPGQVATPGHLHDIYGVRFVQVTHPVDGRLVLLPE